MGERHDSRASEHYPPVGAPDRYDMIVQRGRTLRRRRQYTLGAGAGGTVVALALAVVFVTGGGNSNDVVSNELAEGGGTATTESTTTTVLALDRIAVTIDEGSSPASIVLTDPEFPVIVDAQQCAHITVSDAETGTELAAGHGCRVADAASSAGQVEVQLWPSNGTEIGCAKVETRVDEAALVDYETAEVSTSFSYTFEEPLPGGDYELDVSATSGFGDGCASSEGGTTEVEESAEASAKIEIP